MSTYINYAIADIVPHIATSSHIEVSYDHPFDIAALGGILPRRKADALDDTATRALEAKADFVRSVKRCKRSDEDVDKIHKRLANLLSSTSIATVRKRIHREGEAVRLRKRFLKRTRLSPVAVAVGGGLQYAFTFRPMLNVVVQPASAVTEDIDVLMSVSSDECIDQDVTIDQQQGRAQEFLPAHQSAEVRASGLVSTDIMEIEDKPRMILALDTAASIPHDDNDQVMVPVDMNTFVSRFLARFAAKSTSSNLLPSGPFHGVSKSSHRAFTPIAHTVYSPFTQTVETIEEESLFTPRVSSANSPSLDFLAEEEDNASPVVGSVALDAFSGTGERFASLEEDLFSEHGDEAFGQSPRQDILTYTSNLAVLPESGASWVEADSRDWSPAAMGLLAPTQLSASNADDLFIEDAGEAHGHHGPYTPVRTPVELKVDVFGPVLLLGPQQREYTARIGGIDTPHAIYADRSVQQSHELESEEIQDEIMDGDEQERFFSLPPSPSPSSPLLSSTEHQYSGLHHVDPRKWHSRESRILQDFEEDDEAVVVDVDEALDSELVEPLVVPGTTDTYLESLVFLLDKWTCEDVCDSQVPSHRDCLFSGGYESWYDDLDDDALFSPAVLISGLDFAITSPPQAVPGDFDTPSQTHVSLRLCLGERISLVPSSPLALAAPPPVVATHAFWGSPSLLDLDSEAQPAALPEPYVPGPCDALETLRRDVSLNCAASPAQSYSSLFDGPQDDLALSELQDARSAYFDCDESAALVSPVLSPNPSAGYVLPSAWQASLDSMDGSQI
ncbi:hypothetical protein ONZ51_g8857 [Trametes cubensis]|uniref:Uncharacterized protein n=1 Tax=Trametes cubensis TaxID=1111947 RepID=A0AAD7X656_9APHY|nr:hypothetical protein ONZ51_g8857 [Trametes cubensis]